MKKMNKAELLKLVEDFAHLANSLQLDLAEQGELSSRDEGEFWELISKIPAEMRESVIN